MKTSTVDSVSQAPPSARSVACKFVVAVVSALLCAAVGGARATGPFPDMLSTADRDRLSRYEPIRRATLAFVQKHAEPEDLAVLQSVLQGSASDLAPADMAGEWLCRTIKLSRKRDLPLIIYPDFRCIITDDTAGLRLKRLTGSQRTAGTFYDVGETKLGYVGALALGDETRTPAYGENPERNHVGYLIAVSPERMRVEFPSPVFESDFDILELHRPVSGR